MEAMLRNVGAQILNDVFDCNGNSSNASISRVEEHHNTNASEFYKKINRC